MYEMGWMDGWMDDSTIATVFLFNGGLMQVEFKVKAMYCYRS